MRGLVIVLLAAVTAFAADEPWTKVRDLKSGTELRIFKKGGMHPILAKMEETGGRVTKETRSTVETADAKTAAESPNNVPGETTSSSTNYVFNSQPDFQTIYRRPPPEPKK